MPNMRREGMTANKKVERMVMLQFWGFDQGGYLVKVEH